MHMERIKKTQINAELPLVDALLVIITPLLSTSSLKSANLYLVVDIIIIAVAAEAGLFSFFPRIAGNGNCCSFCCIAATYDHFWPGGFTYCMEKMDGANKLHQSAMVTQLSKGVPHVKFLEQLMIRFTRLPASFSLGVQAKATLKQDMLKIMTKEKKLWRLSAGRNCFKRLRFLLGISRSD